MKRGTQPIQIPTRSASLPQTQRGSGWAWLAIVLMIVCALGLFIHQRYAPPKITDSSIRSGLAGACLDIQHNGVVNGTPIDAAKCNGTSAQDWATTATAIRRAGTDSCLAVSSNGNAELAGCTDAPGQVWLRDQQGYYNPNTGKCLGASGVGVQVRLTDCSGLASASERWTPGSAAEAPACSGSRGEAVACQAIKQWTAWQAAGSNHEALLTAYTDGTPYEEWCADFVSYIYKQAGYPFTNGSADGWDENDANAVQYMGFTVHQAGSGYQPQPGDVAFFDYPGGHVEIVVSGGKTPTFVYGDSAEIDPTTGNGQMKANTIEQGDSNTPGQLAYYMTPNS